MSDLRVDASCIATERKKRGNLLLYFRKLDVGNQESMLHRAVFTGNESLSKFGAKLSEKLSKIGFSDLKFRGS
jgi:hypothetical protein